MIDSEPLAIIADVSRALDNLGVRYLIGGSGASSTHGEYRLTEDIDFVTELEPRHVDGFVAALQNTFLCAIGLLDLASRICLSVH